MRSKLLLLQRADSAKKMSPTNEFKRVTVVLWKQTHSGQHLLSKQMCKNWFNILLQNIQFFNIHLQYIKTRSILYLYLYNCHHYHYHHYYHITVIVIIIIFIIMIMIIIIIIIIIMIFIIIIIIMISIFLIIKNPKSSFGAHRKCNRFGCISGQKRNFDRNNVSGSTHSAVLAMVFNMSTQVSE